MTSINELVAIVLAILNLKGNIEMNLSARLSTAANMGDFDVPSVRNALILGNLALIQVQAAAVSFIAACFPFVLSIIFPAVREESQEPLSPEIRNLFYYSRTTSIDYSQGGPHPVPPPVGVSKSGFNEYVPDSLYAPTSRISSGCVDLWWSHPQQCLPLVSPQLSSARLCQASLCFAES